MKKIIALFFIVLSVQVFSQPEHFKQSKFKDLSPTELIYTQTLVFPGDSLAEVYFLFKVPYKNIVFHKNDEGYNAEIRVDIEVTDTNSNFVNREIKDWIINAASFEQTNSMERYAEGLVNLKLIPGVFNIQPIVIDQNSKRDFKLKKERVDVKKNINMEPLIVDSKKIMCEDKEVFMLTNFDGNIPFGSGKQSLIIPISDISEANIDVVILSREDTIVQKTLTESFIFPIGFLECRDKIIIADNENSETRNFILDGISSKLKEGPFTVIINNDKEKKFIGLVFWYNKPLSLRIPELAIKSLKHIEEETTVDSLLDLDNEKQYRALIDYWKKMDPSPKTEYNELMAEYYSRVDYAQTNFSSLTGIKGVDTDRGMIFIKFGKPDLVERASNENGKVIETWIYKKPQRKFVFIDKQGVGEFSLESS